MQSGYYGYEKKVGGRKMKPIVIIKETTKDGKFELTEKELKELIEQAYEQGYADAKAEYKPNWGYRDISTTPYCGNVLSGKPDPAWNLQNTATAKGDEFNPKDFKTYTTLCTAKGE